MPSSKKDDVPSPSGQRVSALDVRLAELRAKLDARVTPVPQSSLAVSAPSSGAMLAAPAVVHVPAEASVPAVVAEGRTTDVESLALLVWTSLKGDATKVKQLVHALGRLEGKRTSSPGEPPGAK